MRRGWRDEGSRREGGWRGEKATWGEVVTERGEGGRKESDRVMEVEEEEDYGCSSAQRPASPRGPAGPIGPSLALY